MGTRPANQLNGVGGKSKPLTCRCPARRKACARDRGLELASLSIVGVKPPRQRERLDGALGGQQATATRGGFSSRVAPG